MAGRVLRLIINIENPPLFQRRRDMRDLTTSWSLLALAASLLGCSPGVEDYPRELEEAICEWRHACHAYERVGDCIEASRIDEDPEYTYLAAAVAAGSVEYDAAAAADCLEAIAERGCRFDDPDPEVCDNVFRGKVGRNAPCLSSAECAGDAVCGFAPGCRAEDACCVGACRVFADPLAIGEVCSFGGVGCVETAYCAPDAVTGLPTVCTARVKPGGDCSIGQTCAEGSDCDGSVCRKVELRAAGEPCDGSFVRCEEPAQCLYREDGEPRVCVVAGELGAPCDSSNGLGCSRVDTFCDDGPDGSGLCVLLPGEGQACAYGHECLPYLDCHDGGYDGDANAVKPSECRPKGGLGDACGDAEGTYVGCLGELECIEGSCRFAETPASEPCAVPKQ